jgi:hypothetical protein
MTRIKLLGAFLALVPIALAGCALTDVPSVARPFEPLVLTGAQVPGLQGIAPNRLVAFRFVYGTWEQVPVQVDERAVLDLNKPKNGVPVGQTALMYTDPNTFTGADPKPTLDADDEIALMVNRTFGLARSIDDDAHGVHYTLGEPAHVVPGSGTKIKLADPLQPNSSAWVYLFQSDGTLSPGAGATPPVRYTFKLLSGDYKTTYAIAGGPNPEDSVVTTPRYSAHFSDRWIQNELHVTAGSATGVDILDRHKVGFVGTCVRTETTFSEGGGAMIANKSGPVRAIRSYLGANSGTFTQRDEVMYESRMDVVNYLRVHQVPPLRDWMDYSPAATGMTFSASTNPTGVPVDGVADSFPAAEPTWEMVSGPQGTVLNTTAVDTDIAGLLANVVHFYSDNTTPPEAQCTGDGQEFGASGGTINQVVPSTDPTLGAANVLSTTRRMTFLEPNTTAATAQQIADQTASPPTLTVTAFP